MATYTNLTSLASLQVGDVVNYNNSLGGGTGSTEIDFASKNVQVELYGVKNGRNGGYVKFTLNSALLPNKILKLRHGYSGADPFLMYYNTETANAYSTKLYAIAVPGNAGANGSGGGSNGTGGYGGGLTGGDGTGYSNAAGGSGGSQAAGGSGGSGQLSGSNGSFNTPGSGGANGGRRGGSGGGGWYCGGGGGLNAASGVSTGGGGGGSSFILGKTTTVYPSGFMGGDSTLISTIASAISNETITQGGSTDTTYAKMVLTILADPVPTLSSISIATYPTKTSYYTGDTFSSAGLTIYANFSNGTQTTVSSGFTTSSPDMSTAGTKSVTVSYTVDGITKSTSYNITVTALTVTSISLSGNYPTVFTEGDAFSASGLVVTASYNNGSSAVISSGYSITSPNMSQVGTQTVTVSYSGKTASYTITINPAFTPGMKYYNGTNFVLCDVYYYNGTSFVKCEPYYYNGSEFVELGDTN